MAAEITATCRTCQQKHAVNKSLRAATREKSRRSKVKEFGDEVYLDTWFPGDEDAEVFNTHPFLVEPLHDGLLVGWRMVKRILETPLKGRVVSGGHRENVLLPSAPQVSGQNLPATHPQGGGAPPQIGVIQGQAAAAQENRGGAAGIEGDDQDLGVEVQAEVP
uniref:Uncharacterized protein n=1 Tax=Chromera velia CCMP2878 TaxID=1169474 RepID=A0A0G4GMF8_9ALVE|eukprot:Cvel_22553.t1-p1 / transcript=Cvel_22553.t1 / gene=Cvel_22553 / organism=Chromera_velia_CCMP2878 / gene_product=hypothetical protein / transcript_product=hypothetical protein / location=Cvel_scaffold2227:17695-18795(-) / protein_length=162 / sequence_SO=supercontig / SO=protein_coding / is_pseudo=false